MRRRSETARPTRAVLCAWASCAVALACAACGDEKTRSRLPDWSDGYEQGGPIAGPVDPEGNDVDGGIPSVEDPNAPPRNTFSIRRAPGVRWPMRIRNQEALEDGRTTPCFVEPDSQATELEYAESKDIRCMIDMDELDVHQLGVQFEVVVPEGMCDFLLRNPYTYENFEVGVGPMKVSYTVEEDGTFSDEVNSMDGKPFCPYNYKFFDGDLPNCCYGSYEKEVTSAKTGKVSITQGRWGGGKLGDCYYGGGFLDERATFSTEGFPVAETIYMGREPLVQLENFVGIEGKYGPNVALANYYDPADHEDMPPAALRAEFAVPDYHYYCLDDAEEIIAHIAIQVREWNEEVEFDADDDPDTVGIEPGWETPIDDWSDWRTLTPGSTGFPNLPHL